MHIASAETQRICLGLQTYVTTEGICIDGDTERMTVLPDSCSRDVRMHIFHHVCTALNGDQEDAVLVRDRLGYSRRIQVPDLVERDFAHFGIVCLSYSEDGRYVDLFFRRRKLTSEKEDPETISIGGHLLGLVRPRRVPVAS